MTPDHGSTLWLINIRAYAIFDLVLQTRLRVKDVHAPIFRPTVVKKVNSDGDAKKVSSYMISHIDIPFHYIPRLFRSIGQIGTFSKVCFKREITNLDRQSRRSAVKLSSLRALASRMLGLNW